jgi:hypothetical protein
MLGDFFCNSAMTLKHIDFVKWNWTAALAALVCAAGWASATRRSCGRFSPAGDLLQSHWPPAGRDRALIVAPQFARQRAGEGDGQQR